MWHKSILLKRDLQLDRLTTEPIYYSQERIKPHGVSYMLELLKLFDKGSEKHAEMTCRCLPISLI